MSWEADHSGYEEAAVGELGSLSLVTRGLPSMSWEVITLVTRELPSVNWEAYHSGYEEAALGELGSLSLWLQGGFPQ